MASLVGCQRAIENIKNNDFWSRSGEPKHDLFGRMVKGALAEAALAKHFNKFWSKGVKGGADVDDVDVRPGEDFAEVPVALDAGLAPVL